MKCVLIFLLASNLCFAQSQEVKQLQLNIEKLVQLKLMLSHMKKGYQLLQSRYTAIKNTAEGNFSLHKNFLDGLLEISPAVKKYKRIAEIIALQLRIVKEYKSAFAEFRGCRQFTVDEIEYLAKVYSNLVAESLKSLEELAMVITAGKLRMTDDERIKAIDKIYEEVSGQYLFLNEFNQSTALLSAQRDNDKREIELMRKIHGLK